MCGIAGWISATPNPAMLETVRGWGKTLAHRGPDDLGVLALVPDGVRLGREASLISNDARLVLWHRRLSILDLSPAGWQPMVSRDGGQYIVFNGEIYNYLELREELQTLGSSFTSASDTEVLLEAYRVWGAEMLPRLIGMFAFAILDLTRRVVFLARDPFGIKPLYYALHAGGFAFASEQKALLELPGLSRTVNAQRVFDYLRYGLTDHGADTMIDAIKQLLPAHWMEVSLDGTPSEAQAYWRLDPTRKLELGFDEAASELHRLFLENVRFHLRSDVPVGACLSGGIDSSAIVTAMRALEPGLDVHTFSYVADEASVNEERWVDVVNAATNATAHKTHLGPGDLIGDLEHLLSTHDEPFGSTSIYAQYRVFKLARQAGVTVMLDGQGADELLGGYHVYVAARVASLVRQGRLDQALALARKASRLPGKGKLWLWLGEFLVSPGVQNPLRRLAGAERVPDWLNANWFVQHGVNLSSGKYHYPRSRDVLLEQLHQTLTRSSVPMLLRYEDRNSMAHSIESRVPFLTTRLVEFVLALPEAHLINDSGTSKAVFRKAMRGLVPDVILDRKDKIGFATPERNWLLQARSFVDRSLSSGVISGITALQPTAMRAEWNGILEGKRGFDFRVWRWVNLIRWAERVGARF
jgi:asparagine synthase (glutamine-hydrolysing)